MRTWSATKATSSIVAFNLALGLFLFALHSPARQFPTASALAPELPQSVQQLLVQVEGSNHGELFVLTLTDDELSAAADYFLDADPTLPLANARLRTTATSVVLDGVTRGTMIAVPIRLKAAVGAAGGIPIVRAEDISLGDTGLPPPIRDQIVGQVNAAMDFSKYDLLVRIDAIDLAQGSMTIRGVIK